MTVHDLDRAVPTGWVVLGVTPFGAPDAGLAAAVTRGGGLGVLDPGTDRAAAASALRRVSELAPAFGLRLGPDVAVPVGEVVEAASGRLEVVLLEWGTTWAGTALDTLREAAPGLTVLAEVTDLDGARDAERAGAGGLVLRGAEAAGRCGELASFTLLQQVLGASVGIPVWVCGGVGEHTAAGAVACGAAGVVLDAQLSLLDDADTAPRIRAALTRPQGAGTTVVDGRRVLDLGPAAIGDESRFVPAAQDVAWTAARFARVHGTAGAAVRAVAAAVAGAPAAEVPGGLDPSTALPPAQGPMTRVSDRPGFARAVADGGGLPFVAVALSDGPATERLLSGTAAELGERPWGAGILGFVDDALHAAQMAAVRAARPSAVLVAGGRPGQAAALEAEGMATYLHVPSPVLLAQFLAAGARRFVFEGAECGGHLGPWHSFPLWEAQLGIIAEHLDAHPDAELEIYLAGGVHDALSAAIVSAATAPLARRGVRVGVLLGTAYLFTAEAVSHGAIRELFQRQAVAATGTAVVETAPGHRTRCLDTPFVDAFRDAAQEMAGLPARARWDELEKFNTGRLRVASKGIRRDGPDLVEVGDDEQLAGGMYMAGQVAALRNAVTDVASLHSEVTDGAAARLARRRPAPAAQPARTAPREQPTDVAVIGMACAFPSAPDLDAYWSLVLAGTDSVTEVPAERFDADLYDGEGGVTSRWGAFLPGIGFDPLSFGIPPTSMGSIDPAQLLSLEIARRALADSGYDAAGRAFDRERTGVVFGAEAGSDLADASTLRALLPSYLEQIPDGLLAQLPELTEDSFPGTLSNVISGRVANRLDLGGLNYTVDAACGSSLAAVAAACRELTAGGTDLMLCGAVDLHNGVNDYLLFSSVGALSTTGRCRPFDASADGIALGEGVACLVLKRLADAERDGDRIHAVIRGVGAASDGRSLGLTAPRPEGQRRALERAYAQAGISPSEVGLIEAHGTGTVVGDGTELRTLTGFFTEHGAAPGSCALGSVKSQIGHTKCAAGLAGVIRTALALTHGVVPPTLHLERPNAAWDAATSPFSFSTAARPWSVPRERRVAGVSAFGFGGTNFHVVLTPGPTASPDRHATRRWPAELVLLRGRDDAALARRAGELLALADRGDAADLAHTAALLATGDPAPVRAAIVARDRDELCAALSAAADGGTHPALLRGDGTGPGRIAFLFSGQGSQRTGMLSDLFLRVPELRTVLDDAAALDDVSALVEALYPPAVFDGGDRDRQDAALRDTRAAQPALGLVETALHRWLSRLGVEPDLLAGHSYGELAALTAAGSLDPATLLRLSAARAGAILDAAGDEPGAMAAVRAGARDVVDALVDADLDEQVVLANHNSPGQVVVSGPVEAVDRAVDALRERSLAAKRIPVACAFHSPVLAGAGVAFGDVLAGTEVTAPQRPVYANRTAAPYPSDPDGVRAELAAQIESPVRWSDTVEALHADGARTFVEVGPGRVLTALVSDVLGDRPHTAVATGARPGLSGLLDAVARIALAGAAVDPGWLFRGRGCRDLRTATAPAPPPWTVDGRYVRRTDGGPVRNGLTRPARISGGIVSEPAPDDRHRLVADYLAATRELVVAQRDVLLGYLGTAPAAPMVVSTPTTAPALAAAPVHRTQQPDPAPEAAAPHPAAPEPAAAESAVAGLDVAGLDVAATVVAVIGERTGYPPEMIDAELDLEADLSIDSIKRTEIAGLLVERVGLLGTLPDGDQDGLGRLRTAGEITAWLDRRLPGRSATGEVPAPLAVSAAPVADPGTAAAEAAAQVPAGSPPVRQVVVDRVAAVGEPVPPVGTTVAVVPEGRSADAVLARLAGTGLRDGDPSGADVHVDLTALERSDESVVPGVAMRLRTALGAGARTAVVVAHPAGSGALPGHAAGLRGLARAVAAEYPDARIRLVEIPAGESSAGESSAGETVADALAEELMLAGPAVVTRSGGRRTVPGLDEKALPAPTGAATGEGSVVLLVGGGRGIAARAAVAMAASGARVELAGRAAWPDETGGSDPGGDAAALRRAFADAGTPLPQIEGRVRTVLAGREVGATVAAVEAAGGGARYHRVDVRDAAAVHQLVKDVVNRHGRLDGVVFAAGVIADRLLADADEDSWRTVFGTKTDGISAVLGAIEQAEARPRFVVAFGSVAAVLGNRGQTDYAAANAALTDLTTAWSQRTGLRAVTVHWGPWAPEGEHPGMVSAELARDYARRGVDLIEPGAGVEALLAEIEHGDPSVREVLYTAGIPDPS